jgi:hypothetical protein
MARPAVSSAIGIRYRRPAAAEREKDAFMAQSNPRQTIAKARLAQQVHRALLQHPGSDTFDDVLLAAILDDEGVDAAEMEEVSEHEPGGAGTNDPHLGPDLTHCDDSMRKNLELRTKK